MNAWRNARVGFGDGAPVGLLRCRRFHLWCCAHFRFRLLQLYSKPGGESFFAGETQEKGTAQFSRFIEGFSP
jgi:hypothetical protein